MATPPAPRDGVVVSRPCRASCVRPGAFRAEAIMAKGRRHAAERLLAAPAHLGGGGGSGHAGDSGGGCAELPDLAEDDVWPAFHAAAEDDRDPGRWTGSAHRWVGRHVGGLSLALGDAYRGPAPSQQLPRERHPASASAPVDVPAWPRSLFSGSTEREEEEEEDAEWVPPHEYLARTQGKSMATSVLEGVGRTLKGRDMRRVRDAVWSQTGFFG